MPAAVTLLDLFCCGGGASLGYRASGMQVAGVDHEPQPHYPFAFLQADALQVLQNPRLLRKFDVIHASPPCQAYSTATGLNQGPKRVHPDLVAPVRDLLVASGKPWIMENVPEAPLLDPIQLCGSSFGLDVRRHRIFESNMPLHGSRCAHHLQTPRFKPVMDRGTKLASVVTVVGRPKDPSHLPLWQSAMGMPGYPARELAQAIPPAYSEFLGRQIVDLLT